MCKLTIILALTTISYLLGSIPFGFIFFKLAGKGNITKFGSGNIGATNAFRKSKTLGLLTFICDAAKGALAVYIAQKFCESYPVHLFIGVCAVLGHMFPIWLEFKGGKGVSTSLAVFSVTNWLVGVFVTLTWVCTFITGRISGLASIAAVIAAPLLTLFLTHDLRLIIANSIISIFVIIKHHQNIKTLLENIKS